MVLAGKRALVTGAGRGIGRGIAIGLAQAGADVAINYLTEPQDAEETAAEVRRAGRRALLCQADVADCEAVERVVAQVAAEFGGLDIAVSSAPPIATASCFARPIWPAFAARSMSRCGGPSICFERRPGG